MGFLDIITGNGGKRQAKQLKRNSWWAPPNVNIGGATATFDKGDVANGVPGSAATSLSGSQQSMYDMLSKLGMSAGGALNTGLTTPPAVPGYAGISPELYSEFGQSNQYQQNPYGAVSNIYQPNVSNMGSVRGASFDPSGVPQVGYAGSGQAPQVNGGVSWTGKAGTLDNAYLDKSKAFLNASAPVTGFDGLATDWYNGLRQLSADDQNNMLQGTADKQFLRGTLSQETGNGYNPAMKAAFSAYNDQDLKDKMAGYGVAADASQRNLSQALAAGGYVQQNDQTRLQQAIASGQLDLQGQMANQNSFFQNAGLDLQAQMANAGNWLNAQGMGLQAQGMNQNADSQNIANYLQGQGMLTDASGAQASRDLNVNNFGLADNAMRFQQANQRFQNAQNMFGMGQNAQATQNQQLLQQLAAGAGGMGNLDQYLMQVLGMQGNLGSAQSNANLGAYSPAVQQGMNASNFWGGILGSAAEGGSAAAVTAMMSDRRLKTNIEQVGTTKAGYPWYKFDYIWGEKSHGVMSDEVPQDWVIKGESGFDMVDYAKVK